MKKQNETCARVEPTKTDKNLGNETQTTRGLRSAETGTIESLLSAFDVLYQYSCDGGSYQRPNRAVDVLKSWIASREIKTDE